jgi:hypothetical protein
MLHVGEIHMRMFGTGFACGAQRVHFNTTHNSGHRDASPVTATPGLLMVAGCSVGQG